MMENEKDLQTLDDIVFENRNKEYGAYSLRKNYSRYLTKALAFGVSPILLFFLSSFWVARNTPKIVKPDIDTGHTIVDWPENPPHIPEAPKEEVTPPVKQEVLKQVVIPEFLEPVADTKDIVQVEVPTEAEIETAVISTIKQEGKALLSPFDNSGPKIQQGLAIKAPVPPVPPKEEKAFLRSEIMPEFNGGLKKMYKWLGRNLRYPNNATANGVEGKVIVTFIVEKDGGISDVKVLKGIGFGCDEEAERVIKKMPKWKAGIQNGKAVRVRYTIPLSFQIN